MQHDLDAYYRQSRLMIKYWENAISDEERAELDAWLAASDENRALFEELKNENFLKQEKKEMDKYHPQQAWNKIKNETRRKKGPSGPGLIITLIALLLAILLKWCYLKDASPAINPQQDGGTVKSAASS